MSHSVTVMLAILCRALTEKTGFLNSHTTSKSKVYLSYQALLLVQITEQTNAFIVREADRQTNIKRDRDRELKARSLELAQFNESWNQRETEIFKRDKDKQRHKAK